MAKPSRSFYAAAVGHRELPDQYLASFAIPGQPPQWVTGEGGRARVFDTAEQAELAGWRVMAAKLNRAQGVQEFFTKKSGRSDVLPERPKRTHPRDEASKVFSNFKK